MASYWAPTSYKEQQQQQFQSVLPAEIEEFLQTQQIYPEPDFPQSQPAHFEDVTTTITATTTTTANTDSACAKKRKRLSCWHRFGVFYHRKVATTFSNGSAELSQIISYQAVVNDAQQTGEVYVPERYAKTLDKRPAGVAVYKGVKYSASGVEFCDLEFTADEECKRLINDN